MTRLRVVRLSLASALITWSGAKITAEPSATPRLDWLFDRSVTSVARIGNTLYVGGWFRTIRPASAPTANTFHAVAPVTGALVPSIMPAPNASITALTADGSGGYFVAGRFTNLGSPRVAHILADGSVDPAFQFPHVIEGAITSLVRVGPSLVAAGTFLHVDSVFRPLFAMNPVTGALSPWAPVLPNQDTIVRAVVVANDRLIVMSGNGFGTTRFVTAYDGVSGAVVWQTDVAGAPGHFAPGAMGLSGGRLIVGMGRLYSLDPITGVVDPAWAAGMPVAEGLFAMAIGPSAIYVGGTFQVYWGQPRGRLAAVDPATGTLAALESAGHRQQLGLRVHRQVGAVSHRVGVCSVERQPGSAQDQRARGGHGGRDRCRRCAHGVPVSGAGRVGGTAADVVHQHALRERLLWLCRAGGAHAAGGVRPHDQHAAARDHHGGEHRRESDNRSARGLWHRAAPRGRIRRGERRGAAGSCGRGHRHQHRGDMARHVALRCKGCQGRLAGGSTWASTPACGGSGRSPAHSTCRGSPPLR